MDATTKNMYLRPEEASKLLKVTVQTLEVWERKGKLKCIQTKGGHRRFLRDDIISNLPKERPIIPKENICYCRVSTASQKEDLERQVEFFRLKFPDHKIIRSTIYIHADIKRIKIYISNK